MTSTTRRRALGAAFAALALPTPTQTATDALAPGGAIEAALAELAREDRFSGAVLAAMNTDVLFSRAYGLADRGRGVANTNDMRFNLASAGKMLTTVAIGALLERGELSLEDRVAHHLPDFPAELGERITIAQLLSHTSGLGSYFAAPDWTVRSSAIRTVDDYLALVRDERIAADYGGAYRYSNSGFIILGAIIERITRRSYYEVVRERVFEPARMTRTDYPIVGAHADDQAIGYENGCFARPPAQCTPRAWAPALWPGRGSPAGGGFSTTGDLLKFATALKAERLLTLATLDLLKAERVRLDRPGGPIDAYGLGFGRLTIHGAPTWGHNGGTPGAQAQLDVFEDSDLILIVLSNQDGGQRPASAALRRAALPS